MVVLLQLCSQKDWQAQQQWGVLIHMHCGTGQELGDEKGIIGFVNLIFYLQIYFHWIQAIQELMKIHGQDPVSFQDVKDEIFDMVKPKDPLKISLQDLINSNQGDTVTTILIDLNGFWTYENREALVANDNENSADLDDTWSLQE